MAQAEIDLGRYQLGWHDTVDYAFTPKKGLNREVVEEISALKGEPDWMRRFRLRSLDVFERKPMKPWFAKNMPVLDFQDIYYYLKPAGDQVGDWDELPPEIRQTYEKLGIPEAERKYLAGVTAQYECLRGDTLVWTTRGMRPIKTLEAGDEVFSLDESTRSVVVSEVVAGGCSGEKEILEIRARGRTIGASGNHPFLVLRDERETGRRKARYQTRWVPAEDLRVGDYVAVPTDLPEFGDSAILMWPDHRNGGSLPWLTNEDLCWWFGAYLGDGFLKRNGEWPVVEVALDASDTDMVSELRRVALDRFGLRLDLSPDRSRLRGKGTAALAQYLELNGLGGTSHTKRVPPWVFELPSHERLAFLAGFVDADGYVRESPSAKNVVITSTNEGLLEDLRQLALLCGIGAGTVRGFRLRLTRNVGRLPLRSGGVDPGSSAPAHTSEMLGFVRIDSIESVGVEPVFDIEVAGHHNFVAEGFVVHNSEVVFHRNRDELAELGVFFSDMDTGLREYPDIVKEHLGTIIPPADNKFAALNSAVWSGGSFIYVPAGVHVPMPLQAYFRINAENAGQFERTLIVVEEGASVHYVEGCSAPVYASDSLHSAVVEIIAKPGSRVQYTTIQNWSPNVYNLVTKRAKAEAEATVVWIDGNLGSKLTMKYPSVYLTGPKAHGEVLSVAYAGEGQHQDAGAKMIHAAPETSSIIESKSISKNGGRTTYRGLVRVEEGATRVKSNVRCDALILDEQSRSDTYPYQEIAEQDVRIEHEATVSKVGEDQLFYLMSRGLSEVEAASLIVNGFIEPITKTLPMEYAVELSRLIELEMEGAVG